MPEPKPSTPPPSDADLEKLMRRWAWRIIAPITLASLGTVISTAAWAYARLEQVPVLEQSHRALTSRVAVIELNQYIACAMLTADADLVAKRKASLALNIDLRCVLPTEVAR